MPKCDFIEIALRHGCSPVNLLHIFRTAFLKNTSASDSYGYYRPHVPIKIMRQHEMIRAEVNARDFLKNNLNVGGFRRQFICG